jgi:hypothetical protein
LLLNSRAAKRILASGHHHFRYQDAQSEQQEGAAAHPQQRLGESESGALKCVEVEVIRTQCAPARMRRAPPLFL